LLDDSDLHRFLLAYFPQKIQEQFAESVIQHPLKREIIANEVVSTMTLASGISFIPSLVSARGASVEHVIKCLLAADSILTSNALRSQALALDTVGNFAAFSTIWNDVASALQKASDWLVQSHEQTVSLRELTALYSESFARLCTHGHMLFSGSELARFNKRVQEYRDLGVQQQDAVVLSLYRRIYVALEVLWCAREYRQDVTDVARVLSATFDSLSLSPLFAFENAFQAGNKWEQELAAGSFQEIRRGLSRITGTLLRQHQGVETTLKATLASCRHYGLISSLMQEVADGARSKRSLSVSILPLISRHIGALCVELEARTGH
jgi:glutamate dehydrogenase